MKASKANIDRLMAAATAEERVDVLLAWNGHSKTMQEYKEAPGTKARADMTSAREYLQEVVDRLAGVYFPDEAAVADQPEGERFVNRKQAHDWLTAQGYKVSRGKFYGDCHDGFPVIHRDKTISRYQVLQYGQQLDVRARDVGHDGPGYGSSDDEARKLKADADIACMKAERMKRDEDKLWLHADEAWATLAALVGSLRDTIRHHIHLSQRELVHVAGGDQDRATEVFEYFDEVVSKAFNEVAGMEINVVFEKGEE